MRKRNLCLFSYLHTNIAKRDAKGKRNLHFRLSTFELLTTNIRISSVSKNKVALILFSGAKVSFDSTQNIVKGECNASEIYISGLALPNCSMFYKYTNKRERSKTKLLALILFSRAKVSSNSNIVNKNIEARRKTFLITLREGERSNKKLRLCFYLNKDIIFF